MYPSLIFIVVVVVANSNAAKLSILYPNLNLLLDLSSTNAHIPLFYPTTAVSICLSGFTPFSSKCDIVTTDCRCYKWLPARCQSVPTNTNTTTIFWHLSRMHNTSVVTDIVLARYMLLDRIIWPSLSVNQLARLLCSVPSRSTPIHPAPASVSATLSFTPISSIPVPHASFTISHTESLIFSSCLFAVYFVSLVSFVFHLPPS